MKPTRRKPGPRPLATRDKRSYKVQLSFNAAETAAIRKAAGKTYLGTWIRQAVLQHIKGMGGSE